MKTTLFKEGGLSVITDENKERKKKEKKKSKISKDFC